MNSWAKADNLKYFKQFSSTFNFWPPYNPMGSFWRPLFQNAQRCQKWYQRVPMSGHVEESETTKNCIYTQHCPNFCEDNVFSKVWHFICSTVFSLLMLILILFGDVIVVNLNSGTSLCVSSLFEKHSALLQLYFLHNLTFPFLYHLKTVLL